LAKKIVEYNSYLNTGVILGLIINSIIALIIPLTWILYLLSLFSFVSAVVLYKTAKEPPIPLEREAFPIINVQDEERTSTRSILGYFDVRKIKIPRSFRNLKTHPSFVSNVPCALDWCFLF
jgi:hypothetical protein